MDHYTRLHKQCPTCGVGTLEPVHKDALNLMCSYCWISVTPRGHIVHSHQSGWRFVDEDENEENRK